MIYHYLFKRFKKKNSVIAAYIGAGHFGTAVIAQQKYVKDFSLPLVADINIENAKNAFLKAGFTEDAIVTTKDAAQARSAILSGKCVCTEDAGIIMQIPEIDIVCEGSGVPEAGAKYCKMALESGKHIAIVSKETDSAIGPILKKMANNKGLVYTPVDGDQHGLFIQMYEWAKEIGLTVVSGGKSRDGEFILDEKNHTVSIAADGITIHKSVTAPIPEDCFAYFEMLPQGFENVKKYIKKRAEILKTLPGAGAFDLCELTIMANSTGLRPYTPELTQGSLRITELPVAYCSTANGGIYENQEGIIDVITTLRRPDEAGMGGGLFLVVRCDNAYANYILTTKGQIPNYDCSTAVIYRPYHLCGVEVSTTLKTAVMLGVGTGNDDYQPRYDLVKKAVCDIRAGEVLGNDHDLRMTAMICPASGKKADHPVPAHMLDGNRVIKDIEAGETITYSMIEEPKDSILWELRTKMEQDFSIL